MAEDDKVNRDKINAADADYSGAEENVAGEELSAEVENDYLQGPDNEVREGAGADREAREVKGDLTAADVDYDYTERDETADTGATRGVTAADDAGGDVTAGVAGEEVEEDLAVAGRLNADVAAEDEADRTEAVDAGDVLDNKERNNREGFFAQAENEEVKNKE